MAFGYKLLYPAESRARIQISFYFAVLKPATTTSMETPSLPTREAIIEDLKTNPKYQKYYEGYAPAAVDSFIKSYADQKLRCLEHGRKKDNLEERNQLHWLKVATEHFMIIQRKKIFDAECLWNANELKIAEIETSGDFYGWYENLFNCPFVSPIGKEDIRLYIRFLQLYSAPLYLHYTMWESLYDDYHRFRKGKKAYSNLPAYYVFHTRETGNDRYLELPDTRTAREQHYIGLQREANREEDEAREKALAATRDNRPRLSHYDPAVVQQFVKRFESREMQGWSAAYEKALGEKSDKKSNIMNTISILLEEDKPLPINKAAPFEKALDQAYLIKATAELIEAIPRAYDEYLLKQEMQMHPKPRQEVLDWQQKMGGIGKANIIAGRKLAGEPENLDF